MQRFISGYTSAQEALQRSPAAARFSSTPLFFGQIIEMTTLSLRHSSLPSLVEYFACESFKTFKELYYSDVKGRQDFKLGGEEEEEEEPITHGRWGQHRDTQEDTHEENDTPAEPKELGEGIDDDPWKSNQEMIKDFFNDEEPDADADDELEAEKEHYGELDARFNERNAFMLEAHYPEEDLLKELDL